MGHFNQTEQPTPEPTLANQAKEFEEKFKLSMELKRLQEIERCVLLELNVAGLPVHAPFTVFDRMRQIAKAMRAQGELRHEMDALRRVNEEQANEISVLTAEKMLLKNQLQEAEDEVAAIEAGAIDLVNPGADTRYYLFPVDEVGEAVTGCDSEQSAIRTAESLTGERSHQMIICRHYGRVEMSPRFVRG